MDCSCVLVYTDGESAEFYSESKIVARKYHRCSECGLPISPGEEYEHVSGKWEGSWDHYKTCKICQEIRKAFFCEGWHYTMIYEDLGMHIDEMDGEISEDCISDLSPPARDTLCDLIESYWEGLEDIGE